MGWPGLGRIALRGNADREMRIAEWALAKLHNSRIEEYEIAACRKLHWEMRIAEWALAKLHM
jgi:hypothetical protein